MTHKKQAILDSAQYLISSQGYDATSTRSIAKRAKVSEGLIFRHFENKEGLMKSLFKRGEAIMEETILNIDSLTHPKVVIKHLIGLPFNLNQLQRDFLKIYYPLSFKFEYDRPVFLSRIHDKALAAFKSLDYTDPNSETETFMMILEGALVYMVLEKSSQPFIVFETLLLKYELS